MSKSLRISLVLFLSGCVSPSDPGSDPALTDRAVLGLVTALPSAEIAEEMGLTFNVRWQGRVVEEVAGGSPADDAGLQPGDVLIQIDDNVLYSQDDLNDFLAVSSPGQEVGLVFKRKGSRKPQRADVRLAGEPSPETDAPRMRWQYASLGQLPQAMEAARTQKKKVLVGLSGAET